MSDSTNVVLVHGAWADGSSWSEVIAPLQAEGFNVIAPQFPLTSLADNLAKLRLVLARLEGPTVLAGHSYGGHILTGLGDDAPNVKGLVYVAAFGLDTGETIGALAEQGPPPPAIANLEIDAQGYAWLPESDFVEHFAADIAPEKARVLWAAQQPLHTACFADPIETPAWRSIPSWFSVALNDEAIPTEAERAFAARMGAEAVEIESGHLLMVSHPEVVIEQIRSAAA